MSQRCEGDDTCLLLIEAGEEVADFVHVHLLVGQDRLHHGCMIVLSTVYGALTENSRNLEVWTVFSEYATLKEPYGKRLANGNKVEENIYIYMPIICLKDGIDDTEVLKVGGETNEGDADGDGDDDMIDEFLK